KHGLKFCTVAELILYGALKEKTVECVNTRQVETLFGPCVLRTYRELARGDFHFFLMKWEITSDTSMLFLVHVMDIASDVLSIKRFAPDDAPVWTYHQSLERVSKEGGVVLLLCHDETTQAVDESIDWLISGRQQRPNSEVLYKQVGTGSQILRDLGVGKMRVMSAPMRYSALSGFDLEVVEYVCPPGASEK